MVFTSVHMSVGEVEQLIMIVCLLTIGHGYRLKLT